ncbi:(2Fe-2S)-binding protein [Chitinasiproducens palmae]|uniref:Xanthine dehydrogenase YagT iron-sulfur-binding subunit n=1 Tax=Chitinasiproducens palmae TaxID=1770053 RepID=A0A1H2PVN5_9BURK|nr:2Fe-2S iron-sulfur cluster-binding protein [Chitinasiproducens palmae]SDV51379.1 xanthine dehydrogenase YagT iron-sulfur-binding subunit [Chitinasiproducens palmae]
MSKHSCQQTGSGPRHGVPADSAITALPADTASTAVTRRTFLTWVGASGVAAGTVARPAHAALPAVHEAPAVTGAPRDDAAPDGAVKVHMKVNGRDTEVDIDPRTSLLDCLRETLSLTGTKKGCDHGQCGACTVHVNGRRVNACMSLAVMHEGDEITTIEGLGQPDHLHPMQEAFVEHDGYQCGYCTSGQIMSAVGLLNEPWGQSDAEVKEAMSGNLCRCGAYKNIVAAIQHVRKG